LPPTDDMPSASRAFSSVREPSRRIDRDRSLLLVVDIQAKLAPHVADVDALVARTRALVAAARRFGVPVIATEHCGERIGPLIDEVQNALEPREIFAKTRFGATDHPEFVARLARAGRSQVVVAGMESHVCVMQTSLGIAAGGHEVFVVADAVGSRASRQTDRTLALERMRSAGCALAGAETVLFEWAGGGDDAAFRDVLELVKRLP